MPDRRLLKLGCKQFRSWGCSKEPLILLGGGRKGGPKTAKPHRNTLKNRKPHRIFSWIPKPHVHGGPLYECWRDNNEVTGLRNSHLRVIAAKEFLLEKYISKALLLFYGTIGGSLNISLSNNPALLRGGHLVRVEPLEVGCWPFFQKVVITANRLVFWNPNTAS